MPEYTDDQIVDAIHQALGKHDMKAVGGLLALLALQNPERAGELRELLLLASKYAQKRGHHA